MIPIINDAFGATLMALLQSAGLLAAAPLLRAAIKKMKARLQNRQGPPLLQGYYDLAKLLRKEPVRSETASWIYVAGPRVYFAAAVAATTLVPVLIAAAPLEAAGGILLLVGTLALGRFALATAALDTGSPFGGMGASRDMTIAALAEPALMLGLFTSALAAGSLNLGALVRSVLQRGPSLHPSDLLAFAGLFIIVIAETGRIPVDNPATHLELTMIHEVAVLDHSGPDLALLLYGGALRMALFAALLVGVLMPRTELSAPLTLAALVGGSILVAVAVGVVESSMARLRLSRVPQFLVAASVLASLGAILQLLG